ncbi:MAG: hypothetical protein ACTHOO_05340 [Alcanivorax sp.]
MTIFHKKHLLYFLIAFSLFIPTLSAQAQFPEEADEDEVKWERFESLTGVFDTKFPQQYKYKVFPFRFNEHTVAFSTEIISSLDGKEATKDKSILIKATQTFGEPLTRSDVKKILNQEVQRYAQSVRSIGGTVLTNEDITYKEFPGKRLYITYYENGEKYGIRIRIYLTDYSKVEQVLTGPAQTMYSYRSDDFFDSLKLYDGITQVEDPMPLGEGWNTVTSKNNIFTTKLPPRNFDYTPLPPSFKSSSTRDTMNFEFFDPVRNENMFFGIYAYKFKNKATYERAKNILFASHVTKFVQNASIDSLKTENSIVDGVNIMSTKLIITPPKKFPHINTVLLEARYKSDTVIVQEILTNAGHSRSGFPKLLLDLLEFHPEKYSYTPKKKKSAAANKDDNEDEE